jgi:hypothetical protein
VLIRIAGTGRVQPIGRPGPPFVMVIALRQKSKARHASEPGQHAVELAPLQVVSALFRVVIHQGQ